MEDKFILKTGSSLFPKICRSYFLFTPHGLGDFLDQFELVPLFQLGQLVADLTGGKATLRTQAKTVKRDILFCLMDAGDYKAFPYPDGAVVFDNSPFSILASICAFYLEHGIPFFLFAPSLSCFSGRKVFKQTNHIIMDCPITYENGARVKTSFVTSYSGGIVAQTSPDLTKAINRENDRLIKANRKELPKYDYPMNVITAAMMQRYARYGVDLKILADDCIQVGSLDAQKRDGKVFLGPGCFCASAQRQSDGNFRTERKPSYSSLASTVRRAAATTKCAG